MCFKNLKFPWFDICLLKGLTDFSLLAEIFWVLSVVNYVTFLQFEKESVNSYAGRKNVGLG